MKENATKAMSVGVWLNELELENIAKIQSRYNNLSKSDIIRLGLWRVFDEMIEQTCDPSPQTYKAITKVVVNYLKEQENA